MLGIAFVHAFLMTFFVFDLVARERAFLVEQSEAEALSLAEALAATATPWILANDIIGMEELIAAQTRYRGLRYALFADNDGKVLAYTDRTKVGSYLADEISHRLIGAAPTSQILVNSSALIDVAAPVLVNDRLIGWTRVGISRGEITANLQRVTVDGLTYTAAAIVLGSVFAWFMALGLTRGIRQLSAASHRVRQGERDVTFTLTRGDELGQLAESFARMVHALGAQEREVAENNALLHSIIDATPDLIFFKDTNGNYQGCNRAFSHFAGLPQGEVIGKTDYDLFTQSAAEKVRRDDAAILSAGKIATCEEWATYPDGHTVLLDTLKTPYYGPNGELLGILGIARDITERNVAREALEKKQAHLDWLAHYDSLTHLPNRLLFRDRLEQAIRAAGRAGEQLAILFIDLDEFKQINDSLGHAVGDEVLMAVARRFQVVVRESDLVARLGGDEFTVVLTKLHDPQHVARVARQLIEVLQDPIRVADRDLFVSTSIGISIYPDDSRDVDNLLSNADAAMFKAKESGRNTLQFYTEDMTATAYNRIQLDAELRQALRCDEFRLYYQPQYDLKTRTMIGMEALLRWEHPEKGLVAPDSFIPAAEASGLIIAIGKWVLEEASRQARCWHEMGLAPGCISINLSGKQIYQRDLATQVADILERTGCRPAWLGLEVTEGFIMTSPEQSIELLTELRNMGLALAIDDFGTGYSSLAYLKQLPIDKLKIDKSFVQDIPDDPNDMAIAQAVIALGQSLGIGVIAEGVETEAQEKFLLESGCDEGQGYIYSRPVPAETITEMLQKGSLASAGGNSPAP